MAEKTQTRRGPLGWVKRHKKLTIFLVIVLVAALVLVNVLGKTDKATADSYQFVRTTVLTKTTLSDTVSVTGTVKAGSSASVTASDSVKTYKVTAVNVAVGDTVRKGDVIAALDTADVEKQIANAQLQLSDTRTDARKNYTQAVEDQTTNLATAQENLDKAQKNYDTLGIDDYYTSMASAANSGKTNREIVTDWYTRYAEEIAGYENTLANLNIQLTQAQQDGDTARADGLQGQIADYTSRENIAKGQCSIPELGLQGFDAVSQTYNKIEQYREALEEQSVGAEALCENTSFTLGGCEFSIDVANEDDYGEDEENDFSLVVRLTHGEVRFLFAGDAENARLAELLDEGNLASDVLKVPHHGRYADLSAAFFAAVSPQYAVITSDEDDPEDPETVRALEAAGAQVLLTREGAVTLVSDGEGVTKP